VVQPAGGLSQSIVEVTSPFIFLLPESGKDMIRYQKIKKIGNKGGE
jgi:hypothetical protein